MSVKFAEFHQKQKKLSNFFIPLHLLSDTTMYRSEKTKEEKPLTAISVQGRLLSGKPTVIILATQGF
jgi:hypothetical protein